MNLRGDPVVHDDDLLQRRADRHGRPSGREVHGKSVAAAEVVVDFRESPQLPIRRRAIPFEKRRVSNGEATAVTCDAGPALVGQAKVALWLGQGGLPTKSTLVVPVLFTVKGNVER